MNIIDTHHYFDEKFLSSQQFKKMARKCPGANLTELAKSILKQVQNGNVLSEEQGQALLKMKRDKYLQIVNQFVDTLNDNQSKDVENKKIFAVYLGGGIKGGTTEIHDVAFVAGRCLEETYPQIVKKWIGNKCNVHMDSWVDLSHIDGYKVSLTNSIQALGATDAKLYFINFGGYQKGCFGEFHRIGFSIGNTLSEALQRTGKKFKEIYKNSDLEGRHVDDSLVIDSAQIDDCLEITQVKTAKCYVHIAESNQEINNEVHNDYRPLNFWNYHPEDKALCSKENQGLMNSISSKWQECLRQLLDAKTEKEIESITFLPKA